LAVGNAKGLAKLAAYMANKGKLGEHQLLKESTWNQFHSEPKIALDALYFGRKGYTNFTKGGVQKYSQDDLKNQGKFIKSVEQMESAMNSLRNGWYGW
jgi:hypothetical protein